MGNRGGSVYSFKIHSSEEWFRTGWKDSGVEEGQSISFNYDVDDYGNQVDLASLKVTEAVAQDTPVKQVASKVGNKRGGKAYDKASYWANKEENDKAKDHRIAYNAAWNTATQLVTTAVNNGAEGIMGKTPKNQVPNLLAFTEQVALEIFEKYLHGSEVAQSILTQEEVKTVDETPKGASLDD